MLFHWSTFLSEGTRIELTTLPQKLPFRIQLFPLLLPVHDTIILFMIRTTLVLVFMCNQEFLEFFFLRVTITNILCALQWLFGESVQLRKYKIEMRNVCLNHAQSQINVYSQIQFNEAIWSNGRKFKLWKFESKITKFLVYWWLLVIYLIQRVQFEGSPPSFTSNFNWIPGNQLTTISLKFNGFLVISGRTEVN